jgi:glucose repression regulatory protein TUP1
MYGHRAGMAPGPPNTQTARTNELFDQLRQEFENQARSIEQYEHQIQQQVSEMQLIREKVYSMDQTHLALKQKWEEEVTMLRRQLEAARAGAPQGALPGPPPHGGPSQQPPPAIAPGNGLFNGIMTGGGQGALAPPPHAAHPPPEQMGAPQHQMSQGPPGLPAPPPQQSQQQQQQPPFQQPYSQAVANGINSQPPQTTASPGPGRRAIGRPPAVGPATPQINTPIPFPGAAAQSPQVSHPTPDHARVAPRPPVGNSLGELDIEHLPPHCKKQGPDWFMVWNQHVPRLLDVDLVHTLDHTSVVCCVRFSHDGQYVATGCNRSAQIYDVQTGEQKCLLQDESADVSGDLYIRSVCFSPDGKYLATGAEDKLIRVRFLSPTTLLPSHDKY